MTFNKLMFKAIFCISLISAFSPKSFAQVHTDSILEKLNHQRYAEVIIEKTANLEKKLTDKSLKALDKLQQQEEKIYRKLLSGKDSIEAKLQLATIKEKYGSLKSKMQSAPLLNKASTYIPNLDSLTTSLKFLDGAGVGGKIKDALGKTNALQDKFDQAEAIKKFIKERRELLKAQFEKLGMVKQLKKFNKEVYYYAAQVKEYKEILKDPKKIEKKAMELLAKTKLFQNFMKKNSLLSDVFGMGDDPTSSTFASGLQGLQTRAQLSTLLQQQVSGAGNIRQQFQQNIQSAQSAVSLIRSRLGGIGNSNSSDDILPKDFRPNEQKTKSFFQRIELSTSVQSKKSNGILPVTSDLGLSIGYKLNGKSIAGVGVAYKLGFGRGWRNITLTHQGLAFRSFIDWKLKGNLWICGGFEMNYRSAFNSIEELKIYNAWQRSGLLGISKSTAINTKFFKKTKVQILWDFLSYAQTPKGQPIVFRIGYSLSK